MESPLYMTRPLWGGACAADLPVEYHQQHETLDGETVPDSQEIFRAPENESSTGGQPSSNGFVIFTLLETLASDTPTAPLESQTVVEVLLMEDSVLARDPNAFAISPTQDQRLPGGKSSSGVNEHFLTRVYVKGSLSPKDPRDRKIVLLLIRPNLPAELATDILVELSHTSPTSAQPDVAVDPSREVSRDPQEDPAWGMLLAHARKIAETFRVVDIVKFQSDEQP